MFEMATRWANAGHSVTMLCSLFEGAKREESTQGVRIVRVGGRYTVYLKVMQYLRDARERLNYDVIFESINTVPFFCPLVSRTPVVAQIYSIDNKKVLLRESRLRELPLALGAYVAASGVNRIYRNCEITTISEYSKQRLIEEGFDPLKILVAYPGISASFYELLDECPTVNRPNSRLVYLGRLKKYKGVQDIIRALPLVKKEIPDVQLLIIGKGDYEQDLRALTSSLHLSQNVIFCGFVSEKEKAAILKSASVFVCTSIDEGGWTISGVEAMAAGLPIIVTKSQFDLVRDYSNGFLVDDANPTQLATKIRQVLNDRATWNRFSQRSQSLSRQFNWDRTAERTLTALEKAAQIGRLESQIKA